MNGLKKENNKKLAPLMLSTILLCAGVQYGFQAVPSWQDVVITGAASTIVTAVLLLFTNLLPQNLKHKIVFTRLKNELPGCRVHIACGQDSRISLEDARLKWPSVFEGSVAPAQRNAEWYKHIYKGVKNNPAVTQSHQLFLLYRDAMAGTIVLLIFISTWDIFGEHPELKDVNPAVYLVLIISVVLLLYAARTAGKRFVVNAVANSL